MYSIFSGTFSVACLIIETTVSKGYETSRTTTPENANIINRNNSDISDGTMSEEELNIRLSYALSLTFMVGIIQVSQCNSAIFTF